MRCDMTSVQDLTIYDIPNALAVSVTELGTDYLSEKDFLEAIGSDSAFCKVVTYNRQFAGFGICQIFGPEKLGEMLHLPDSPEKRKLLSMGRIGLLDSVAVRRDLKGLGIGTGISAACLSEFELRNADVVCAMAWKSTDGTINIEGILRGMGMSPSLEIPGYWNMMVDPPGGHDCPVCGRPCRCSAVLYCMDMR